MTAFTMPSLGADMDEGTLLEWLVKPGDTVKKGDIVAVVDTSKAAVEVETFSEGVVGDLLVEPGTRVPVGTPLATIEPAGATPAPAPPAPAAPAPAAPAAAAPSTPAHPPRVVPLVRRLAADLGVDLDGLRGTGPHGAITRDDVTRAAAAPPPPEVPEGPEEPRAAPAAAGPLPEPTPGSGPTPGRAATAARVTPYARRLASELGVDLAGLTAGDGRVVRAEDVRRAASAQVASAPAPEAVAPEAVAPEREGPPPPPEEAPRPEPSAASRREEMRATIGARMARAKREIPHYYLSTTVDLGSAIGWMREQNLGRDVSQRLLPAALLLKATALAAAECPDLNGFWIDGGFRPGTGVHLGVAVSLRGGGLVAPAIHDADALGLDDLMAAMKDLVVRTRAGRLRASEMSDPTLTVTNLGEQGVESVLGVIYPPQVALVGFGRVVDRPWAVDGLLGVRPVTTLTLAADHRATDGFTGGRFLAAIERHLQVPEEL